VSSAYSYRVLHVDWSYIILVKADDENHEMLINALNDYHCEGLTSNAKFSARLLADSGITMRYVHCIDYRIISTDSM
jgi:hypothetical protein